MTVGGPHTGPYFVNVNRPFIFLIKENHSNTVMFNGRFSGKPGRGEFELVSRWNHPFKFWEERPDKGIRFCSLPKVRHSKGRPRKTKIFLIERSLIYNFS